MKDTNELAARAAAAFEREETERARRAEETEAADIQKIWRALEDIGIRPDRRVAVRNRTDGALCVPIFDSEDTREIDPESREFIGEFRPAVAATLRGGEVWILAEHEDGDTDDSGKYLPVGPLTGLATIGKALARGGQSEYKPPTAADKVKQHLYSIPGDNVTRQDAVKLAATEALCIAILDLADAIRTTRA